MIWYFSTHGNAVYLQARPEGRGIVGDAVEEVRPGKSFYGLSFAELKEAGSGQIQVVGKSGKIRNPQSRRYQIRGGFK